MGTHFQDRAINNSCNIHILRLRFTRPTVIYRTAGNVNIRQICVLRVETTEAEVVPVRTQLRYYVSQYTNNL